MENLPLCSFLFKLIQELISKIAKYVLNFSNILKYAFICNNDKICKNMQSKIFNLISWCYEIHLLITRIFLRSF
jgi:hypothetical protein